MFTWLPTLTILLKIYPYVYVFESVCICFCVSLYMQGLYVHRAWTRAWDVFVKHLLHIPLCEANEFLSIELRFSLAGRNPTIPSIPLPPSPWELELQASMGPLAGFNIHYCTANNLSCWTFYLVLKSSQFLLSPLTSINIFKWRLLVRFLRFQSVLSFSSYMASLQPCLLWLYISVLISCLTFFY